MTDKEILEKAIEKASTNGYPYDFYNYSWEANAWVLLLSPKEDGPFLGGGVNDIIFSHDFAKAFWGKEHQIVKVQRQQIYCQKCGQQVLEGMPMVGEWQFHLQQLVLESDPIKYLEKFI